MITLPPVPTRLVHLPLLAILVGLSGVLTAAMGFQYLAGEIPCPLCLLQRVAMFGICFGIIRQLRHGYDPRSVGISLIWALFLLIVAARQVLINIVARPGHAYPGSVVLGLHMPVWSVVIAVMVLLTLAATLALFDADCSGSAQRAAMLEKIGRIAAFYVIALCVINFISATIQCGSGACHTTGYKLLGLD